MSEFNSADESSRLPKILCGGLCIAVLATLVYWPSLKGTFIIDDDQYVTQNPNIYFSDGLARIWLAKGPADFYNPIPYSTFWLEWRLWGMNPTGYRITNLTLHIVTAWLLWAILQKLSIPGAFLGALLFTVHPVNVECVAWIFQRRDLLAVAFCLLSIACYLQADPRFFARPDELDPAPWQGRRFLPLRTWGWYALSLAAYVLGMLSKISIAPLPLILLLIVWWKDRLRFWDLARIGPFFLADAAIVGFNLWLRVQNFPATRSPSLAERLDRAGAVVWFYLSKALLPINLSLTYPQWHINTSALLWWLPLLAAASVTALLFWQHQRAWSRALIFAWAVYCVAIAPVSGIDDLGGFGHSIVWDHYEHLALIGAVVLVAAGWGYWRQRTTMRRGLGALAAALVGILSVLAWQRSALFGSPLHLFQDAVVKNPESWLANLNYGSALAKTGRREEAIVLFRQLLQTWPDFAEGHRQLGVILLDAGRPQEAAECYQQALRLDPNYPPAHLNLGLAYELTDRLPEAIQEFEIAIRMDPNFSLAHYNLGYALNSLGRTSEAIDSYREALRLKADMPEAEYNLAVALEQQGKLPEAIEHVQRALRLKPNLPEAEYKLALTLEQQGKLPEAIEHFQRVLRLKSDNPEMFNSFGAALSNAGRLPEAMVQLQQALQLKADFPEAHNNLGIALSRADRTSEGIEQFQEALRLKPDYADAHLNLGVALSQMGQLQDGIRQFDEALRLNPDNIKAYTNMTQAYVLLKRPAEAIASAEKAVELARAQGKTAEAAEITAWLATYRSQQNNSSSVAPRSGADPPAKRP